jgi:hypothetical protein
MLLTQNYGFWEPWTYPQKVSFDGVNKLIYVNYGETFLDVKTDVYSAWKEWVLDPEHFNSAYEQAIRAVGGDPTVGGSYLGTTYFLMNGWRMKTWEGDHRLQLAGNLFTEEGEPPFVPTTGPYTIVVEYQVSSITTVAGALTDNPTAPEIAAEVWDTSTALHTDLNAFGGIVRMLAQLGRNKTVTDPIAGTITLFDDNGIPLLVADLWEDAAATQPYRGRGADRRERFE